MSLELVSRSIRMAKVPHQSRKVLYKKAMCPVSSSATADIELLPVVQCELAEEDLNNDNSSFETRRPSYAGPASRIGKAPPNHTNPSVALAWLFSRLSLPLSRPI